MIHKYSPQIDLQNLVKKTEPMGTIKMEAIKRYIKTNEEEGFNQQPVRFAFWLLKFESRTRCKRLTGISYI